MRSLSSVLRRIRDTSASDRHLLAQAGVLVMVARGAMWITSARAARRITLHAARVLTTCDVERAPWAVTAVSRYLPGATCLTQALALQALLVRAGHPCRVEIGVAKSDRFEAHAWVVSGGRVVLGDTGIERFRLVTTFE